VLLEFPLDHVTVMTIGREIGGVLGVRKVGPFPGETGYPLPGKFLAREGLS
jgi:hypothetical protein